MNKIQIHILIHARPGSVDNMIEVRDITGLQEKLLRDYGYRANIYFEKPAHKPHTYFLYFANQDFELNKAESQDVILMATNKSRINDDDYFNEFDFAAFVESIEIMKDNSLFFGKKSVVANKKGFECLNDFENDYCYIHGAQKKGYIGTIVDYINALDEFRYKERN